VESLTKPITTTLEVSQICLKHLGDRPANVVELKEGWFNTAFLIHMADESEYVLKIAPTDTATLLRYERQMMTSEVDSTRMLKRETGLPLPNIIAYDESLKEVASNYFLMERLPGIAYDVLHKTLDVEGQRQVELQVGGFLRDLDSVRAPGFGMYRDPCHSTWTTAFAELMQWLRMDVADRDVDLPAGVFEAADPYMAALETVIKPVIVHWDLWYANIFVDPDTLEVTGLIDFERALYGDRLMECNFMDSKGWFVEGYGHDPVQMPFGRERRFLYDLYLYLVMIIESRYRGFTSEHEALARKNLADVLSRRP
jgi:aminoglycoside phosphotransferase (APT) family kinase protein